MFLFSHCGGPNVNEGERGQQEKCAQSGAGFCPSTVYHYINISHHRIIAILRRCQVRTREALAHNGGFGDSPCHVGSGDCMTCNDNESYCVFNSVDGKHVQPHFAFALVVS